MVSSSTCCPYIYQHKECINKIYVPSLCQNCRSVQIFAHKLRTHPQKVITAWRMQSVHAHGGANPEQRPPSSRLFLEMLLVDTLIRNIPLLYKMRLFLILQQPVLRTSTWNPLKPVPTITNYLRSTLILLCHVWLIVIRHSEKKL